MTSDNPLLKRAAELRAEAKRWEMLNEQLNDLLSDLRRITIISGLDEKQTTLAQEELSK